LGEEDGSMTKAARIAAYLIAVAITPSQWLTSLAEIFRRRKAAIIVLAALAFLLAPHRLIAQTDCLACHSDKTMQNAAGHNISVDGQKFSASIHGSLQCSNCHADIKE
jgi:hypothetical protein